jgi:TetR/AcrR family transcriptional regulator, transcriptional repressor for nem operon
MRVSNAEKLKSRTRIVESAAKLVRERGVAGTSVADVMQAAGMTHGGFYRHFETKEQMLEAGIAAAFVQVTGMTRGLQDKLGPERGNEAFRKFYLSEKHRSDVGAGCPVAACGTEVGRLEGDLQQAFEAGIEDMLAAIGTAKPGKAIEKRKAAIRELSMLVGAMVMARTCGEGMAQEIFRSCLEAGASTGARS